MRGAGSAVNTPSTLIERTIADDVESYTGTVAGVEIESLRAGPSVGPTLVTACNGPRLTFTSSSIGFPMMNRTTVPDDAVLVAHIGSSSPRSRWCEIELEPGMVLAYGPQAEHTAFNAPGLAFTFAFLGCDQLLQGARELGTAIEVPEKGAVHALAPNGATALIQEVFPAVEASFQQGECPSPSLADEVLRSAIHGLTDRDRVRRIGQRRIDSRKLVRVCIDYAESIRRIPSIGELCLTAHVSERRLRKAFVDEFDQPPSQFFRAWALNQAHRRLTRAESDGVNVTTVASDLGFAHLGRFSGQYRAIYGEAPSSTLRRKGVRT